MRSFSTQASRCPVVLGDVVVRACNYVVLIKHILLTNYYLVKVPPAGTLCM